MNQKEGIPLRRGPITRIALDVAPPIKRRGRRLILKRKTGSFEPEELPHPTALATALPTPAQDTTASPEQPAPKAQKKRKARTEDRLIDLLQLKWLTVRQASLRYPAFSDKAFRHLIAQAEAYAKYPKAGLKSTGFLSCIVRPGNARKILIDAEQFDQYLRGSAVAGQPTSANNTDKGNRK